MPPFDFTAAMRALCEDICVRSPEMRHIHMDQVAVTFAQARRRVMHGLQAKLTPLRFENGSLIMRRGNSEWTIRRMFVGEQELLYILTFYLPRFQDNSFREKLITVFHELYHISPQFNGDIRRLDGRYHVHSHSQCEYDVHMGQLADDWLKRRPPESLWKFLEHGFHNLHTHHGGVIGLKLPIPKLIRLPKLAG